MCQTCIDKRNAENPDGWKCVKCGSTNTGGIFRGDTQCFECRKK